MAASFTILKAFGLIFLPPVTLTVPNFSAAQIISFPGKPLSCSFKTKVLLKLYCPGAICTVIPFTFFDL